MSHHQLLLSIFCATIAESRFRIPPSVLFV